MGGLTKTWENKRGSNNGFQPVIYGYYMVIIWLMMVNNNLVGGIPTYPSEKSWSESQYYEISQYIDLLFNSCCKPPFFEGFMDAFRND